MTDQVTSIEDLTPEQVDKHMQDDQWGAVLEGYLDRLLEDSSTEAMEVAYALISMFVQNGYVSMLYNEMQNDAVRLYELGVELRRELDKNDIKSQATHDWDVTMTGLVDRAKAMQVAINNVTGA
jgi:hypothetical protein